MIVRDKPNALHLLFAVRGSVLPHIAPALMIMISLSVALVLWDRHISQLPHLNSQPFAMFGVALSLFLGFRNNAAYDRWWEARKLWGALVADARALAREAELFLPDPATRQLLLRRFRAFLHLHRCALRGIALDEAALRQRNAAHLTATQPDAALTEMNAALAEAYRAGTLSGFGAQTLSARMAAISLAQASCERIKLTPLPYVYSLLIFRTSWIYCLLLPLALLETAGWLTPVFTAIVGYSFFGLAEVTEELAHPFGQTANALPLDAICRAVEISLAPHLDETAPPPLLPQNYRLD
ncbi:putative membrane protein [Gemmobacter aquatilis]|uniref:Putative membrane protein n=1 Tax=Gemmobacter aquatilis TaxID=933059 RepID=A0A1H8CPN6_9RHOB|nr:bestrophin family protein [Gemmobacter aquatilis]SEM96936.1 putative membrane protein [Gemmobacter aquatilis]